MKGLSITAIVLGGAAPIVMALPLLLLPFAGEGWAQAGWAFFFASIPLGLLLSIAGVTLAIVAGSLAIKRGYRPIALPIVGICLAGSGLLLQLAGVGLWPTVDMNLGLGTLAVGIVVGLAGVVISAVAGLRASGFSGRRRIR